MPVFSLYRHTRAVTGVLIFLTLVAIWGLTRLTFVFELERFFPSDDEDMAVLNAFRATFEDDDNFLLLALDAEEGLLDTGYLFEVKRLTAALKEAPHVVDVQSITNTLRFTKTSLGMVMPTSLTAPDRYPERYQEDSLFIAQDRLLRGRLISDDMQASILRITTKDGLLQKEGGELMSYIHGLIRHIPSNRYHLLGKANFQDALVRQQIKEFILSTAWAIVLVTFMFWFFLRTWAAVGIAVLSICTGMLVFVGMIGVAGVELDVLSMMLPVILVIVCVSDVVHLMFKYRDEWNKGLDQEEALAKAVREIGTATLLTSVTTAIGFLTLLTSSLYPVRLLGMTAASGVMIAYGVIIVLTPALLRRIEASSVFSTDRSNHRVLNDLLGGTYRYVRDRGKQAFLIMLAVIFVSLWGLTKITTDVVIYDSLPSGIKPTEDFAYFESKFAGFRPFEVVMQVKDGSDVFDQGNLNALAKLQRQLEEASVVDGSISIVNLIHRVAKAGEPMASVDEPLTPTMIRRARQQFRLIDEDLTSKLVNKKNGQLRISSTIKDVGSDGVAAYTAQLHRWVDEHLAEDVHKVYITGTGAILDKNNHLLRQNLMEGLTIGFLIIAVIMAFLFKDVRMLIISLIPNVFPLFVAGACMGYLNIPMDAPTSIIFAIAFGIAVDDTIHFLSKVKLDIGEGIDLEVAIHNAVTETGKAIVITSLILMAGFLIMLISATLSIRMLGMLSSVTMAGAVVADLILLPILLRWWLLPSKRQR